MDTRIDGLEKRMNTRIDGLEKRLDSQDKRMNTRIDGLEKRLDSQDKRLDSHGGMLAKLLAAPFQLTQAGKTLKVLITVGLAKVPPLPALSLRLHNFGLKLLDFHAGCLPVCGRT
jgi:uncharacterized coiled-coil protein SlyX